MLTLAKKHPSINPVAAKSATGIGTPCLYERTDAPCQRLFLCRDFVASSRKVLNGDCAAEGQPQGWSVSRTPIVPIPKLYSSHPYLIGTGKGGVIITQYEDIAMSSNLVSVQNGQATTTSLQIAAKFGKRHDTVLRKIETLECSKEFTDRNFAVSDYIDESGKTNKAYKITYDGFVFLAMGFTGATAAKFKEDYIAAFRTMEQHLTNHLVGSNEMVLPAPAHNSYDPSEFYLIHKTSLDSGACVCTHNDYGTLTTSPINPESVALLKAARGFVEGAKLEGYLLIKPEDLMRKLAL